MSYIDWSKAPEEATHATKEFSSWYRYRNNNGTWYFYHESNQFWVRSECSEEWREVHLIARPTDRDKAIGEMTDEIVPSLTGYEEIVSHVCTKLYDAGYRKGIAE